mmetsp:Transcript_30780/g.89389  ORF Transcript_30780/g.89389 Transcript_30780/m.89389 type:complete len:214 (+) Transcript_30780:1848-2489(+)
MQGAGGLEEVEHTEDTAHEEDQAKQEGRADVCDRGPGVLEGAGVGVNNAVRRQGVGPHREDDVHGVLGNRSDDAEDEQRAAKECGVRSARDLHPILHADPALDLLLHGHGLAVFALLLGRVVGGLRRPCGLRRGLGCLRLRNGLGLGSVASLLASGAADDGLEEDAEGAFRRFGGQLLVGACFRDHAILEHDDMRAIGAKMQLVREEDPGLAC